MSTKSQFYTLAPDDGWGAHYTFKCDDVEVGEVILIRYPTHLSVWSLEIYPEFRRLGHARALMSSIYAIANHEGPRLVWLRVDKTNEEALALYTKEGFVVVEERGHALVMERKC